MITKNPSAEGPSLDTGTPVPVSIDYVDSQLTELWRDVAEAAQAKGGIAAVTMAQVLNLLVRADSQTAANNYTLVIDAITGSHPARVITMLTDPNEDNLPVQAWVSIHCQVPPAGGRQVCCEQIWVASGANTVRQVPAAVIPLILAELPVFLWWPKGSPLDDYLFRQLGESLDRLIVDSATFENAEGDLAKMASRLRNDWPKIACTDVNWERLTMWREMVAQFFDGAGTRPYLDRIRSVDIEFSCPTISAATGRTPVNRAQALLLAGWLASRLGWQPVEPVYEMLRADGNSPSAARLSLLCGGDPVTILIRPGNRAGAVPGDLLSVKLEVAGQDPNGPAEASFEVCMSGGGEGEHEHEPEYQYEHASINVEIAGTQPTRRSVHMEEPTVDMLLDKELEVFSHDKIYEEALEVAGIFIRGTGKREGEGPRKLSTGEPVSAGAARSPSPRPNKPQNPNPGQ
ncbi:MAG: glucose-6-phosphate dehydrogenase assembly protein OpcA [Chloroflexia bacterium]